MGHAVFMTPVITSLAGGLSPVLADALLKARANSHEPSEKIQGASRPSLSRAMALGALASLAYGALILTLRPDMTLSFALWLAAGMLVAPAVVICDVRSRVIPIELCIVLVIAGIGYDLSCYGLEDALVTAIVATGVTALLLALRAAIPKGSVGLGDIWMTAATVAYIGVNESLHGTSVLLFTGIAAALVLLAVVGGKLALKRIEPTDRVPLGFVFTFWILSATLLKTLALM